MSDLSQKILDGAPISMATFMARGVKEYYSSRDPFGERGDFVTAPEISQMFGEMIGVWMIYYWSKLDNKSTVNIVELGPGRGTLMVDALRTAKVYPGFLAALNVHLVEVSPVLKEAQISALSGYDVTHHDDLAPLPKDAPTIIIANEFFDALPVHQLIMKGGQWRERVVTAGAEFGEQEACDELLSLIPAHLRAAPEGKIIEVSPARATVMAQIDNHLSDCGGAALIIDYGYNRLNYGDTIQAIFGHKFCNVLEHVGEADLTSHVDFGALMTACKKTHVAGFSTQGKFLTALGIYQRMQLLKVNADEKQQVDLEQAIDRLCSLDKMGQLFKVLCVTHDKSIQPAGF